MQRNDLAELAGSTGFPRVSIYIPTHRTFPEAKQDPIRLSNAVKEAERQLIEADVRQADDIVAAARERTAEHKFWRYQDHGLAVLIENGTTRWMKLPKEVAELIVVGRRYHVRPLIDLFADAGTFHVLAATRDSVRFFDGSEHELEEIKVDELPKGLDQIRGRTDFENQAGYHASSRGSSTRPKYHALGESPDDYEAVELEQFAKAVAKAIDCHLSEGAKPLILIAQPRLLGRLRQELKYDNIAENDIQRNPAPMDEKELHDEAWELAEPLLRKPREELRSRCKAWIEGAEIAASADLEELMHSAEDGRIETLLLSRHANVWGQYDETNRKVSISDENVPENEDLLNLLALKTLHCGGDVISLSEELAEDAGPAVGLYRY